MSELYVCEKCGLLGLINDFNDDCKPGWTHGKLIRVQGPVAATMHLTSDEIRYAAIACDLYADEFPETVDPDNPARASALLHAASAKLVALDTDDGSVAAKNHDASLL